MFYNESNYININNSIYNNRLYDNDINNISNNAEHINNNDIKNIITYLFVIFVCIALFMICCTNDSSNDLVFNNRNINNDEDYIVNIDINFENHNRDNN